MAKDIHMLNFGTWRDRQLPLHSDTSPVVRFSREADAGSESSRYWQPPLQTLSGFRSSYQSAKAMRDPLESTETRRSIVPEISNIAQLKAKRTSYPQLPRTTSLDSFSSRGKSINDPRRYGSWQSIERKFPHPDLRPWPSTTSHVNYERVKPMTRPPRPSTSKESPSKVSEQQIRALAKASDRSPYPTSLHSSLLLDSSPLSTTLKGRAQDEPSPSKQYLPRYMGTRDCIRPVSTLRPASVSADQTNSPIPSIKSMRFGSPRKVREVLGYGAAVAKRSLSSELQSSDMNPIVRTVGRKSHELPLAVQMLKTPLPALDEQLSSTMNDRRRVRHYLKSSTHNNVVVVPKEHERVFFSDVGDINGHVVLLIPGLSYTRFISAFMDTTARLAGLRIVTVDWPNVISRSRARRSCSASFPQVVHEILRQLGCARYSILAHSTGAMFAVQLAAIHAHQIVDITLLSPFLPKRLLSRDRHSSCITKTSTFERHGNANKRWIGRSIATSVHRKRQYPGNLSAWSPGQTGQTSDVHKRLSTALWRAANSTTNSCLARLPDIWLLPWLPLLTSKFTILHGFADPMVPIEYSRRLNDLLPHSELQERIDFGELHQEILCTPIIMAEVLENISKNLLKDNL